MSPALETITAALGVFVGSLIWDFAFGDGIQADDIYQAITVALLAALLQWLMIRARSR